MENTVGSMAFAASRWESPQPKADDIQAGIIKTDDEQLLKPKAAPPEAPDREEPGAAHIRAAVEDINKNPLFHGIRFEYSVHEKINAIMVKVVDARTGELIREVPPKKVLDIAAMTWEEMGILIDEKA